MAKTRTRVAGPRWIYALAETDGHVRYIGMSRTPEQRVRWHVGTALRGLKPHRAVNIWLSERLAADPGWRPVLVLFERVEGEDYACERAWIRRFLEAGAELVNERNADSPTLRARASEANRRGWLKRRNSGGPPAADG